MIPQNVETKENLAQHAETVAARSPFRDFEYALNLELGKMLYCAISGDPIFNEMGEFQSYRGVGRNITEAIEADMNARALERKRDRAVAANTVMNRFLATMSH